MRSWWILRGNRVSHLVVVSPQWGRTPLADVTIFRFRYLMRTARLIGLFAAHTWTIWQKRSMTNCRKLAWSALQNCVKTMTCLGTFYLGSVSEQPYLCLSFILFFYMPNINVVCLRSWQSESGSSSKEKWTSTTGESYLRQLLLLATGLGSVGCSVPSQGIFYCIMQRLHKHKEGLCNWWRGRCQSSATDLSLQRLHRKLHWIKMTKSLIWHCRGTA